MAIRLDASGASRGEATTETQTANILKKQGPERMNKSDDPMPLNVILGMSLVFLVPFCMGLTLGLDHDDLAETLLNILVLALTTLGIFALDRFVHQHPLHQEATGYYDKRIGQLFRFAPYLCCLAAVPFYQNLASNLVSLTIGKLASQVVALVADGNGEFGVAREEQSELDPEGEVFAVVLVFLAYDTLARGFFDEALVWAFG